MVGRDDPQVGLHAGATNRCSLHRLHGFVLFVTAENITVCLPHLPRGDE